MLLLVLCDYVCGGIWLFYFFFFFQAEDGIRDADVTGVQTCALPISRWPAPARRPGNRPPRLAARRQRRGRTALRRLRRRILLPSRRPRRDRACLPRRQPPA